MQERQSTSGRKPGKADSRPPTGAPHSLRAERHAMGKRLREACPRNSHAEWKAPPDRSDPVKLMLRPNKGRLSELLPLRHGRMVQSPFTFYRGSALAMAVDLAATPATGVCVQCGRDSHLVDFWGLATPERQVIFALNDLDDTLPSPWEWDLKRLAARFVIASRDNGLGESVGREAVIECVRSYREHVAELSEMKTLDLWYHSVVVEDLIAGVKDPAMRRRAIKRLGKAREASTSKASCRSSRRLRADRRSSRTTSRPSFTGRVTLQERSIRTSGRDGNGIEKRSRLPIGCCTITTRSRTLRSRSSASGA